MPRRTRQTETLVVFAQLLALVSIVSFVGGISFEMGRWIARSDTDNNFADITLWRK